MRGTVIGTLICCVSWGSALRGDDAAAAPAEPAAKAETQIKLNVKIVQLSIGKMREAGIDFDLPEIIGGNKQADREGFAEFLNFLRRNNLVHTEAEPTLATTDGRTAYFHSGPTVAGRKIGTQVELTPTLTGEGRIHCSLHVIKTEIDPTVSLWRGRRRPMIPGFKTAEFAPDFDVDPGSTMICGGPILSGTDPKTGGKFETRMIYVVTPELVVPAEK